MLLKHWLLAFGQELISDIKPSRSFRIPFNNDEGNDDGDSDGDDGNDGDDDGDDDSSGGDDDSKNGKFMTQTQIDRVVEQRLNKERKKNRQTLQRLKEMEQSLKMSDKEREELQSEIADLEKRTLTADEIRKREEKKAKDQYESQLADAKKEAEDWKKRHDTLYLSYNITTSAAQHGVSPNALPMLSAYLEPRTKLVEVVDDDGKATGRFTTEVDFDDRDDEGKVLNVQMPIDQVIGRMRELPDHFGYVFEKDASGGLGATNGKPAGQRKDGWRPGMSMTEFMKIRKENPEAIFGQE